MTFAPAHRRLLLLPFLALGALCAEPALAKATVVTPPPTAAPSPSPLVARSSGEFATFYAYHAAPLWFHQDGTLDPAATELVRLIETADDDGLSPPALHAAELAQAVAQAQAAPSSAAQTDAELLLSHAFVAYVAALRQPRDTAMVYEAANLRPHQVGAYRALDAAAKAPSLAEYVHDMRWMHPLYAPLRRALMDDSAISPADRRLALANLSRIRQIPDQPNGRHVLIDAANATLWMYDGDKVVDSMRVIVGKAATQTPAYAGYIRYAIVNPYWNVPDNLVRSLIARNVLSQGKRYLDRQGYEVASSWDDDATVVDPSTIDWHAVQRGDVELHVRQRPGPLNSMGKVKYEFPNVYGIYLHDTPEKALLQKDVRQLSNGCVRLEDAKRLGQWLMEGDIHASSDAPEEKIDLPRPVPLYVTYLTAHADGDRVAVSTDPYDRDGTALAALD